MATRTVLVCLAAALLWVPAAGQADELADARKAVETAGERLEMAKAELSAAYSLLRCDHEFVKSDRWARLSGALVTALRAAAAKAASDPDQDLPSMLDSAFAESNLLSPAAASILAGRAAEALLRAASEEKGPPDFRAILDEAAASLFPSENFDECWSANLDRLDPVARYREAVEKLSEAEKRLAAAESGEPTPEPGDVPAGMVLIPGGRYKAGPWTGWVRDIQPNKPKNERIDAFYMDIHEVTNGEFLVFLRSLENAEKQTAFLPSGFEISADGAISIPEGTERRPVRGVTFEAARAFAKSKGKRLPTEAEWEWAARGRKGNLYPWGDEFDETATNCKAAGLGRPTDVGASEKDESPFGVRDMAGNVSEMTANLLGREIARKVLEPTDQIVCRGGNYAEGEKSAMTTYRWVLNAVGGREETVGFRCVISEKDWKKGR